MVVSQNAEKNFFRRRTKKSKDKKKYDPFFVVLTFGRLFSQKKYAENLLCLLSYMDMKLSHIFSHVDIYYS